MGTRCVCCDTTTDKRLRFDPSTGRTSASGLELPRCDDCIDHVATGNNHSMILLALLSVGVIVLAIGATNAWPIGVVGALIIAGAAGYHVAALRKRASMREQGHHTGLEIVALPDLVNIRTTNPRFAQELRSRNRALLR